MIHYLHTNSPAVWDLRDTLVCHKWAHLATALFGRCIVLVSFQTEDRLLLWNQMIRTKKSGNFNIREMIFLINMPATHYVSLDTGTQRTMEIVKCFFYKLYSSHPTVVERPGWPGYTHVVVFVLAVDACASHCRYRPQFCAAWLCNRWADSI